MFNTVLKAILYCQYSVEKLTGAIVATFACYEVRAASFLTIYLSTFKIVGLLAVFKVRLFGNFMISTDIIIKRFI